MNLTEFLARNRFSPHGSVINTWDSFRADGAVLMQLWEGQLTRLRNPTAPTEYARIRCFESGRHDEKPIGKAGRLRAIAAIEGGALGLAVISSPPSRQMRGPGVWAKHANLDRAYPIIRAEREHSGDVFVVVGLPVSLSRV